MSCYHPSASQGGHTTVVIDVNWRPVFWDDETAAKAAVLEYIQQAHILKVTDEVGGCCSWLGKVSFSESRHAASGPAR